jgi:hypothetical protein
LEVEALGGRGYVGGGHGWSPAGVYTSEGIDVVFGRGDRKEMCVHALHSRAPHGRDPTLRTPPGGVQPGLAKEDAFGVFISA